MSGVLSEVGRLGAVLVKHARDAFVSQDVIAAQWQALNFTAPPDYGRAIAQYDAFLDILTSTGATIVQLPRHDGLSLDSIYTRDASIVTTNGVIACSMAKTTRRGEPIEHTERLRQQAWPIAGAIVPPGLIEGGDVVWLDDRTLVVGQGARTNAEGIRQLTERLGDSVDRPIIALLPEWDDPHDVMHLMSLVSPVDVDLAVVYARLLPPSVRDVLLERGYRLIGVPDDEFETMGTNVLAIAPRECIVVRGNPRTRAMLERAHARVHEYDGSEISLKGGGGPTCLTRPLAREKQ